MCARAFHTWVAKKDFEFARVDKEEQEKREMAIGFIVFVMGDNCIHPILQ